VFDQSSPWPVAPHPPLPLSSAPLSVGKSLISEQGLSAPENSTHHQKWQKPACYERISKQHFIAVQELVFNFLFFIHLFIYLFTFALF
jgi:hypothetical protein